jgi:diketogulonate reductase-like aldo/keto reductase
MPSIAFGTRRACGGQRACISFIVGTWRRGNGEVAVENVKAAIGAGFTHVGASPLPCSPLPWTQTCARHGAGLPERI